MSNFPKKQPIMVLTFDDFRYTDVTIAYPELSKRGFRGTSYVNPNRLVQNWCFSFDIAKDMASKGWDIQCHTFDHPDLSTLTEPEVRAQITQVTESFLANGMNAPEHHAYPFGGKNAMVERVVGEYRKTQRGTGIGASYVNTYDDIANGLVKGVRADMTNESDWLDVKASIDKAIAENGVVITYTHSIVNNITDSSQCLHTLFTQMLDYAVSKGIKVMTMHQMYNTVMYQRKYQ